MTFGVDECRVCGKAIGVQDAKAVQRYQRSLSAPPKMTEKEWRAAGFKAAPTKRQMMHPWDGTCFDCRFKIAMRTVSLAPLYIPLLAIILAVGLFVFWVVSNFT